MRIDQFAKAILAAVIAGLSALMGALTSGDGTWDSLDAEAWVGAAISFLTALAVVYFVPNAQSNLPPDGRRAPERRPNGGDWYTPMQVPEAIANPFPPYEQQQKG